MKHNGGVDLMDFGAAESFSVSASDVTDGGGEAVEQVAIAPPSTTGRRESTGRAKASDGANTSGRKRTEVLIIDIADSDEERAGEPKKRSRTEEEEDESKRLVEEDKLLTQMAMQKAAKELESIRRLKQMTSNNIDSDIYESDNLIKQVEIQARADAQREIAMERLEATKAAADSKAQGRDDDGDDDASAPQLDDGVERIGLKVRLHSGQTRNLKIRRHDPLMKLLDAFRSIAAQQGWVKAGDIPKLVLKFDGDAIRGEVTAEQLDLEDEDLIDVDLER